LCAASVHSEPVTTAATNAKVSSIFNTSIYNYTNYACMRIIYI